MIINVKKYSDEKNDYIYEERKVIAQYRYLKDGDKLSCIKDKVYNCIGYDDGMLAIVDETGEAYLYDKENFELIEDAE